MIESDKINLIESYVSSYNSFDIAGLLAVLDDNIVFENEANGEINMRSEGKPAFEKLASESAKSFSTRQQTITDLVISDESAQVSIDYKGTLATDLPSGLKAGQTIELKGKTQFEFNLGKISYIKDVS